MNRIKYSRGRAVAMPFVSKSFTAGAQGRLDKYATDAYNFRPKHVVCSELIILAYQFAMGSGHQAFLDLDANRTAAEFVRGKIGATVHDPEVAARLQPDTVVGCKRLCVDTGYYETFNRDDVELVDLGTEPIVGITPGGVRLAGREVALDCLVFATGFDAMTGALLAVDLRGRDGRTLREAWAEGPKAYLGLGVAGFPNLFLVNGPGSPSVLSNMVVSIEHHVEWITDCMEHLRTAGRASIEPDPVAQDTWAEYVGAVADLTLFPSCNSWYLGANVPGKPRVFLPLLGFPTYVEQCAAVVDSGYDGFVVA